MLKNKPLFPIVHLGFWPWVRLVSNAIRTEVKDVDKFSSDRRSLLSRASKMFRCLRRTEGRVCDACGRPLPGGMLRSSTEVKDVVREKKHRGHEACQARACPRCARRRATVMGEKGRRLARHVTKLARKAKRTGTPYRLRFVTMTAQYDPSDPNDLTSEALGARLDGILEAFRTILAVVRDNAKRPELIGAAIAFELAGVGNVHAHLLWFGPYIDYDKWLEWGCEPYIDLKGREYRGWPGLGERRKIKLVRDMQIVREIMKYPLKSPGSGKRAAQWIGGRERRWVINPVLAARWEVATLRRRLIESWGTFRKIINPATAKPTEDLDPPKPCVCGCAHSHVVSWPTEDWFTACRIAGVEPFGQPKLRKERMPCRLYWTKKSTIRKARVRTAKAVLRTLGKRAA